MGVYISMLRGINVSGQKRILMADLKGLYEELGLKEVVTYIQSGNVLFKAPAKASLQALAKKIEQAIEARYHFDVTVVVRTAAELESVLTLNPFIKERGIDTDRLHVTFLAEEPGEALLVPLSQLDYPPDRFAVVGKEVFIHCPDRYGDTKLTNSFFEKKLKTRGTTRNWKTVNKLVSLAGEMG